MRLAAAQYTDTLAAPLRWREGGNGSLTPPDAAAVALARRALARDFDVVGVTEEMDAFKARHDITFHYITLHYRRERERWTRSRRRAPAAACSLGRHETAYGTSRETVPPMIRSVPQASRRRHRHRRDRDRRDRDRRDRRRRRSKALLAAELDWPADVMCNDATLQNIYAPHADRLSDESRAQLTALLAPEQEVPSNEREGTNVVQEVPSNEREGTRDERTSADGATKSGWMSNEAPIPRHDREEAKRRPRFVSVVARTTVE